MTGWRQGSARSCWTALLALGLVSGCAGNGPPPAGSGSQFDQLQSNIFDQHCLSAGCHNSQAQAGALDLSAGVSYGQLVNVLPNNPAALSAGLLRVVPFDPTTSFLLIKLTGPGPGEGGRMPLGMDPLSPSDIEEVQAWIVAGAPPGGTVAPTPTPTVPPTPSPTPSPADTATPVATVTGTPPATSTATATRSASASPTVTPTLSAFGIIQTTIFNTTCVDSTCHDAAGMAGGLVLIEGQSYANLVNVLPTNAAALNAGLLRVDPGLPDNSFLVVKLAGPPPIEGGRMPLGKPPLSAAQMELIRGWITAGAQP